MQNTGKASLADSSENSLRIQKAKFAEMPAIAKIIGSSSDWYRPFLDEKDMPEHEPDEGWILKNFFRREFFLARDKKGAPVGTISVQNINGFAYLGYIYVDAGSTGQGIGGRLIDHARQLANKRNLKGMFLIAHPEAVWATKAYRRYGFELKACTKEEVLAWNNRAMEPYYEEGFQLYYFALKEEFAANL